MSHEMEGKPGETAAPPLPPLPDLAADPIAAPPHPSPPRGVLLMAWVRWGMLLAVGALAVHTVRKYGLGTPAHTVAAAPRYYCPMHPEQRSADPGECPICHMDLERIPADRSQPTGPMSTLMARDASVAELEALPRRDAGGPLVPVVLTLERQQSIGVATEAVVERTLTHELREPAAVEAAENTVSQVHVRAAGFVELVEVRATGGRVYAGQVLAWMYSPTIYQAASDLLAASRWGAVDRDGGSQGSAAGQALSMQQAARQSLNLLGVRETDIDAMIRSGTVPRRVPIRAPAAGVVTQRTAVLGMYAQPESVLYEITDLSRVWVVASVHENERARIRRGDTAHFVFNGDATPVEARVQLVGPELDVASRTVRVRMEVANPAMRLMPGQFGEVLFAPSTVHALAVPRDAVVDTGERQYVFVDRGEGRFEPRPVRLGAMADDWIEVLDGLRVGERVVTRGAFLIDSESRLRAAMGTGMVHDGGAP